MNKINVSTIAFLNLCLLLPLLHLQSYFSGSGYIPIVRGRIFLFLFFSLVMFIVFLKKKYSFIVLRNSLIFFFLIILCVIVIISNNTEGYNFIFNLSKIFFYIVYFFTGFFFFGLEKRKKIVMFFWSFMIINLFFHYDFNSLRISLQGFDENLEGVYLFLGDSFALWSILVLSFLQKKPFFSVCIVYSSTVCLFSFISRTALYSFILVVPIVVYFTKKSIKYYFIFILISIFLFSTEHYDYINELNSRMFAFQNLDKDRSVITRSYLLKEGLSGIERKWFIGDYLGQLRYGNLGSYIHNYLSLWRQFGLIPFVCFCFLLLYSTTKAWKIYFKLKKENVISPEIFFLITGGAFCLIEILFARSYTSPYIWFFIGMSINLKTKTAHHHE